MEATAVDIRKKLLEIYSRQKADEVGDDPDYCALCERYEKDRPFDGLRNSIERTKRELESTVGIQNSPQESVKQALKALNKRRFSKPDREVCLELIRKTYSGLWNDAQQDYFKEGSEQLMDWQDFFLSFTSRNPAPKQVNAVNTDHYYLIDHIIPGALEKNDLSKNNLLAEAIHCLLVNQPLRGFYYPTHKGKSEIVKEKLQEAARCSFAFVQLIQNHMFVTYPNYCHFEYTEATQHDQHAARRLIFVMDGEYQNLIDEGEIDFRLGNWYDDVKSRDPAEIKPTRWPDPDVINENYQCLLTQVVQEVKNVKHRLFENVPISGNVRRDGRENRPSSDDPRCD